jgi:hypothetical protein
VATEGPVTGKARLKGDISLALRRIKAHRRDTMIRGVRSGIEAEAFEAVRFRRRRS